MRRSTTPVIPPPTTQQLNNTTTDPVIPTQVTSSLAPHPRPWGRWWSKPPPAPPVTLGSTTELSPSLQPGQSGVWWEHSRAALNRLKPPDREHRHPSLLGVASHLLLILQYEVYPVPQHCVILVSHVIWSVGIGLTNQKQLQYNWTLHFLFHSHLFPIRYWAPGQPGIRFGSSSNEPGFHQKIILRSTHYLYVSSPYIYHI